MKWNKLIIYLVIMGFAAAAWKWTPAGKWVSVANLTDFAGYLRGNPAAPLLVIGAYLVLGFLVVPLLPKVIATTLIFGVKMGFVYSVLGSLISAMVLYGVGRLVGQEKAQRFAHNSFDEITDHLADHGMIAMTIVRLVPLAPFTIINFVAGAIRIRVLDYTLGTIFGMTPAIFLMTLFSHRLLVAIQHPGLQSYLILASVAVFLALLFLFVRYLIRWRRKQKHQS